LPISRQLFSLISTSNFFPLPCRISFLIADVLDLIETRDRIPNVTCVLERLLPLLDEPEKFSQLASAKMAVSWRARPTGIFSSDPLGSDLVSRHSSGDWRRAATLLIPSVCSSQEVDGKLPPRQ
jgi:hypothetical protein